MNVRPLFAAALLVPATGLLAQQAPPVTKDAPAPAAAPAAALPSAQQIVDRYVAAVGGKAALQRIRSYRATGSLEMPTQGIKGDLELSAARPNKLAMKITIPGMGEMVQGYDGTVGWSVNPMQGPRLLEGKELAQMVEEADFDNLFRGASSITSRETIGRTELGGQPCYQVKTVRRSGTEAVECYSVETGLLVGTSAKRETPMGQIESTTLVSDYKDFGGIRIPTRSRIQIPAMGAEQVLSFTNVEFDKVDAAAFARPAAVEALAKQAKP